MKLSPKQVGKGKKKKKQTKDIKMVKVLVGPENLNKKQIIAGSRLNLDCRLPSADPWSK